MSNIWGCWTASEAYSDTACTTLQTADGGAVAGLKNLYGIGGNLTQATGSNQPVRKNSQVNSLPSILFDGSNDFLDGAVAVGKLSAYIVFNPLTASGQETLVAGQGGTFRDAFCFSAALLGASGSPTGSGDALVNSWQQLAAIFNDASSIYQINNLASQNLNPGNTPFSNTAFRVGMAANNSQYLGGHIAEILAYTAVHDPASGDGLLARQYLNTKYNLGLGI